MILDKSVDIKHLHEALDKSWSRTPVLLQKKRVAVLISGSGNIPFNLFMMYDILFNIWSYDRNLL